MRCIIGDDEHLVRFSVQDMLEEITSASELKAEIVFQAADGEELVRAVSKMKPDLVFVDIRMPKVEGLDAIKAGRITSPDTQWVILTGYADFAYAKRAVSLAAIDFLLKPASKEDIERVLRLAVSRLYELRSKKQLMLEHKMLGLLQDTFSEDTGISHAEEMPIWFSGFVFVFDTSLRLEDENNLKQDFVDSMRTWMSQTSRLTSVAGITLLDDSNLVCTAYAHSQDEISRDIVSIMSQADDLLAHTAILQQEPLSLVTRISCNESVSSLTGLMEKLKSLSERAYMRIADGIGEKIPEDRLIQLEKEYSEDMEALSVIERVIKNRELEPVKAYHWLLHHQKMLKGLYHKSKLSAFIYSRSGERSIEENDENAISIWISWVYEEANYIQYGNKSPKRRLAVDRALAIITEQYTEEIGLAQVADILGLTPNYLSTEFNQAMGVTFSQYITDLRMKLAVDLLKDESITVKEVSCRTGYVNSRHFSKVFKKYFGYAPSEHNLFRN